MKCPQFDLLVVVIVLVEYNFDFWFVSLSAFTSLTDVRVGRVNKRSLKIYILWSSHPSPLLRERKFVSSSKLFFDLNVENGSIHGHRAKLSLPHIRHPLHLLFKVVIRLTLRCSDAMKLGEDGEGEPVSERTSHSFSLQTIHTGIIHSQLLFIPYSSIHLSIQPDLRNSAAPLSVYSILRLSSVCRK